MKRAAYAVLLSASLAAGAASAQGVTNTESARTGAVQLKLGPYSPGQAIDAETEANVYEDTFDGAMLLFEIQYDRYVWQKHGALGVGFSAGYAEKYGPATVVDGAAGSSTSVKTALQVFPLKLMAIYNWDYALLTYRVPLVPYARAGVAYVPWRSTVGGEISTLPNGNLAQGGKWGITGTAGISFLLDVLEPRMARDFDSGLGVNHSYLFAEYNLMRADSFKSGLDLSSSHFMFGMTFEF